MAAAEDLGVVLEDPHLGVEVELLGPRSIVKREMRGRDIFETRRSNGSPGGEVFGLKVGKYCM